jgi:UDP-galactopyranose mutase
VVAQQLAEHTHKNILIIEEKGFIGGTCHDHTNKDGLLVHDYGPHVIHTDNEKVWQYLSRFTEWYEYKLQLRAKIKDQYIPLPFNLNSIKQTHNTKDYVYYFTDLLEEYGENNKIPILELMEHPQFKELAEYIYHNVLEGYTKKQWDLTPEQLDPEVTGRIPLKINHNNNYFNDKYQATPKDGYTVMFERMTSHPQIHIMLNTRHDELIYHRNGHIYFEGKPFKGLVIFTGRIDQFFHHVYGELPYRSLQFKHVMIEGQEYVTPYGVVTYPNTHKFTRRCEFKHFTGQQHDDTVLCYEYPQPYTIEGDGEPFYPIPTERNREQYEEYKLLAEQYPQLIFTGRLGKYQYKNMDEIVSESLELAEGIIDG